MLPLSLSCRNSTFALPVGFTLLNRYTIGQSLILVLRVSVRIISRRRLQTMPTLKYTLNIGMHCKATQDDVLVQMCWSVQVQTCRISPKLTSMDPLYQSSQRIHGYRYLQKLSEERASDWLLHLYLD